MQLRCKLKEIMDARGLSQLAVAKGAQVTPGSVGRMYRDHLSRIDNETVDKITTYLGITKIQDFFEFIPGNTKV